MDLSIGDIAGFVASTAIVVGGIVPYIPQYREIKLKEDSEGFSLYVCLALLIANTLRILFWFGKRFELPLLLQSILMNITMLMMIKLCVNVRNKNQIIKSKERIFIVVGGLLMWLFVDYPIFVETVGLFAVLTEAMLGVPQFLRNLHNKSTDGMSIAMVAMWTVGDTFKTCYFIQRKAPTQFTICGALQVIIDSAILLQVYIYKSNSPARPDLRAD